MFTGPIQNAAGRKLQLMNQMNGQLDDTLHWYKDAIIYELHIKAFRDSDGDGIGDFGGLLEKLDYLKDLGVTAIWVLPFYPSPLKDDGYDIADYYSINPSYGDISQFKQFLEEAHERNLKVITELVINHTSDQHPWFQRARKAPERSVEREYYVWTDDPQKYKDVRIIFQDFETSNWTWDPVAEQYYWHRFFNHQPDLNYDNPAVQQEVFKIIDYWCAMGVDGFRLDAVPYLYERENTNGENLPETHQYLKKLRQHIDENFPGTVLLAEANMWPEDSASYFGNGDECHMNYHFPVMPRMFMSLQMEDRYPITDIFDQTPEIPETCQWAIFLRNHDELTLEMVTDEERDYMYKVYAKDPKAKINLGIRHRLGPLMENNRRKIELMNVLLFSLRGTPVIYYGDEIGMGDNFYLGDRDGVRTPMQWSPDRNAGFSMANPQKLYLPLILDPEYHYESVNVETQRRNPSSLLWFMKHLINTRKKHKAFSRGDMKFINVENPKVLAFTRSYREEIILMVVNLSRYTQSAELELADYKGFSPVEVFSRNKFPAIKEEGNYFFTLGPHGHYWFRLEKAYPDVDGKINLPEINLNKWENLSDSNILEELTNNILPGYLLKTQWFEGKERVIRSVFISNYANIRIQDNDTMFLLFDVIYESSLPETYQLPVIFLEGQIAATYSENFPTGVTCRMNIAGREGLLCDALYTPVLQQEVFKKMANNQVAPVKDSEIRFIANEEVKKYFYEHKEIRSRVLPVDDNNTSIGYDNLFFLKIYRHVDLGINPDVEITKFLTEQTKFIQVPPLLGTIVWKYPKDSIVLGIMQTLVEYHGNGRTYMLERLNNYHDRIVARETHPALEMKGALTDPVSFENFPDDLKEFIGGTVSEGIRLIAVRTGEMHKALSSRNDIKQFAPEEFSLHYQRSLFAGLQSVVRGAFNNHKSNLDKLAPAVRKEAEAVLARKDEVLKTLKKIYTRKLDVSKIRIHGNYDLKQVVFTGKDLAIVDFHGDPTRTYSERRLKRSPLRDVAGMIRSIHYVAHEGLLLKHGSNQEELRKLEPFAALWTHYVSGLFMKSYLDTVQDSAFIPKEKGDLKIMLDTYLLEKAVYSLNYELKKRPQWAIVPIRIIKGLIG
jgi:maltose alpha-D-glucosyltransferase/alpha-amylase